MSPALAQLVRQPAQNKRTRNGKGVQNRGRHLGQQREQALTRLTAMHTSRPPRPLTSPGATQPRPPGHTPPHTPPGIFERANRGSGRALGRAGLLSRGAWRSRGAAAAAAMLRRVRPGAACVHARAHGAHIVHAGLRPNLPTSPRTLDQRRGWIWQDARRPTLRWI